ncbi:SCO family protein [Thermocrinis minervae]|uniref:Protein SCO1/2 n=1 Tax=Thermocrinis minervae TaxID=381751 RepID=A0A1M6QG69_9AQUI|nr:SCO family protein [Thermocrinis minervae]SHK19175.1 protein SCO1/2 [Thermocrinis minervae]
MSRFNFLFVFTFLMILWSCQKPYKFYGHVVDLPAYDFELTNQDGKREKLSQLLGKDKVALIFFGYTNCPDVCPDTLQRLATMYKKLSPEEQKRVKVIFISVDPERDTPQQLKGYVPFFNPNFMGFTGTPDEIRNVAKEYKVYYRKVENSGSAVGYLVDHTASVYLVTPDMKIKAIYTPGKQDPDKMAEDLRYILRSL